MKKLLKEYQKDLEEISKVCIKCKKLQEENNEFFCSRCLEVKRKWMTKLIK